MSEHRFKVGEKAFLLCEITGKTSDGTNICKVAKVQRVFADDDDLHPAPREGEYRLTVNELENMIAGYVLQRAEGDPLDIYVKQWLANRKEEA